MANTEIRCPGFFGTAGKAFVIETAEDSGDGIFRVVNLIDYIHAGVRNNQPGQGLSLRIIGQPAAPEAADVFG